MTGPNPRLAGRRRHARPVANAVNTASGGKNDDILQPPIDPNIATQSEGPDATHDAEAQQRSADAERDLSRKLGPMEERSNSEQIEEATVAPNTLQHDRSETHSNSSNREEREQTKNPEIAASGEIQRIDVPHERQVTSPPLEAPKIHRAWKRKNTEVQQNSHEGLGDRHTKKRKQASTKINTHNLDRVDQGRLPTDFIPENVMDSGNEPVESVESSLLESHESIHVAPEAPMTHSRHKRRLDVEQDDSTEGTSNQRPRKKPRKIQKPSEDGRDEDDEPDSILDNDKVTMWELCKESRKGEVSTIEAEMQQVAWKELREREKAARYSEYMEALATGNDGEEDEDVEMQNAIQDFEEATRHRRRGRSSSSVSEAEENKEQTEPLEDAADDEENLESENQVDDNEEPAEEEGEEEENMDSENAQAQEDEASSETEEPIGNDEEQLKHHEQVEDDEERLESEDLRERASGSEDEAEFSEREDEDAEVDEPETEDGTQEADDENEQELDELQGGSSEEERDTTESTASEDAAAPVGPRVKLGANGTIEVDQDTLTLNRHERSESVAEEEPLEISDVTRIVNSRTWLFDTRKDPRERYRIQTSSRWSEEQTDLFYEALARFGTDFYMISSLFPNRTRRNIKTKFTREEKLNPEKIDFVLTKGRQEMTLQTYCAATGLQEYEFQSPEDLFTELENESYERRDTYEKQFNAQRQAQEKKLAENEAKKQAQADRKKRREEKKAKAKEKKEKKKPGQKSSDVVSEPVEEDGTGSYPGSINEDHTREDGSSCEGSLDVSNVNSNARSREQSVDNSSSEGEEGI